MISGLSGRLVTRSRRISQQADQFADYSRIGVPLQVIIMFIAVPALLLV
jgi:hypothetical protein